MLTVVLATCLLAAAPETSAATCPTPIDPASSLRSPATPISPLRRAQDLRRAVSDTLRREAQSEPAEHEAAVRQLLALYQELAQDTALTEDERRRLLGKVRSRLTRVSARLEQAIARHNAQAKRQGAPPNVHVPEGLAEVLGQQLNQIGQGMARGADPQRSGEALIELIKTTIQPGSWDDQGGPGSILLYPPLGALSREIDLLLAQRPAGAAGGRAVDDYGPELVELIQTVIAPATWDVNGGPAAIRYYRPLRVLVIRQSTEVHGEVGGVLGQMRQ